MWQLELAVAALEGNVISCDLREDQIYAKVIVPLWKSVNRYLERQGDDCQEMLRFLEDACFTMESETETVLLNRLLTALCRSTTNAAALRMLPAFLFYRLPLLTESVRFPTQPVGLESGTIWDLLEKEGDGVECAIVIIGLQVGVLQADREFLKCL